MNLRKNLFKFLIFMSFIFSTFANASVLLSIAGGPLVVPGSTVTLELDLAGSVIYDKFIPFRITNSARALLFSGKLQNRIVKSSISGELHFYYRIVETVQGVNGIVRNLFTTSFITSPRVSVDWRPDGLGTVHPITAKRSAVNGNIVQFNFDTTDEVMAGGLESNFFFVKTSVKNFSLKGTTRIQLTTGDFIDIETATPIL